jgi:hypothetical protein
MVVHVTLYIFFIHQWHYSPLFGPGLSLSFVIFFTQTVGLLGGVSSPSQGRYLHTGQHKHRINAHTNIRALSGIRTHDPSVRAREDGSCLRTLGHCNQHIYIYMFHKFVISSIIFSLQFILCKHGQSMYASTSTT